ncbi:MAG: hypothetical protein H6R19_753 [Proteobacteria bacterium]|nr:hypothetical protein [Pseudomonadota bacterium]
MLALVTVATDQVLTRNLAAGIYPVDADSIGIPLVMALVKAVVVYVVLLPAAILPSLAKHWHSRIKRTALLGISLISLLLGLLLCGLNGLSWLDGDHFLISLAWWGFALFAGTIVVIDLRRGYPIKPDQTPPAAPAA